MADLGALPATRKRYDKTVLGVKRTAQRPTRCHRAEEACPRPAALPANRSTGCRPHNIPLRDLKRDTKARPRRSSVGEDLNAVLEYQRPASGPPALAILRRRGSQHSTDDVDETSVQPASAGGPPSARTAADRPPVLCPVGPVSGSVEE